MTFHKKHIELVGTVTTGPKGQVVIPVDARVKMSVEPYDKLVALYLDKHKTVAFVPESEMQTLIDKMGEHLVVITKPSASNGVIERFED